MIFMKSINKNSETELIGLYHSNLKRVNAIIRDQFTLINLLSLSEDFNQDHERERLIRLKLILNNAPTDAKVPMDFAALKITRKEQQIMTLALANNPEPMTTNDLHSALEMNRSQAWNYFERLIKKGILNIVEYGKPSKYQLTPNYLHFLNGRNNEFKITENGGEKTEWSTS